MDGGSISILVVWGLVLAAGIAFAVKPLWMWIFTESWKPGSEDGPSKQYLRFARTFGAILALIGGSMLAFALAGLWGGG